MIDLEDSSALYEAAGQELSLKLPAFLEQWYSARLLTLSGSAIGLTVARRFWYADLITALHDIIEASCCKKAQRSDVHSHQKSKLGHPEY